MKYTGERENQHFSLVVIAPLCTYFVGARTTIPAGVAIETAVALGRPDVSRLFISEFPSITHTSPGAVQVVDRAVGVILLLGGLHLS